MRILICDDHSVFAEAMAVVLASRGHEVVGWVSDPDEARAVVEGTEVDVCMMDLSFPRASGVDGTAAIVASSPRTHVVVVTGSADPNRLAEAVRAGAHGLATKSDDLERIISTLERVHAGERVFDALDACPPVARRLPQDSLARFLTQREREVLHHLALGETTADLARAMGIRYSTARTHIQSALTKLGVHSKLEAVVFAVSHNLVPFPEKAGPGRDPTA